MYLIDKTSHPYFQSLAQYVRDKKGGIITNDYSLEGTWVLFYPSFLHEVKVKNYIAVHTEQLNAKGGEKYLAWLAGSSEIWDWTDNFKIGYSDVWRLEYEEAKEIDVLFYGLVNNKRAEVLQKIPRTFIIKDYYGTELMKYAMKSKIVLSTHYYANPNNDLPRIAPLLSNKIFVIAEECEDKWFNDYRDSLVICSKEEIPEKVKYYLNNPLERIKMIDKGYELIKTI